jgi:two-component system OmpR family response regulator
MEPALAEFRPDVILLDVNMPHENGFDAARRLRPPTDARIIMLTARGMVDDRILGYSHGADGYLSKPVDVSELVAMIHSLYGRLHDRPPQDEPAWVFDAEGWTLSAPDGTVSKLSAAEYRVLAVLFSEPGQTVDRSVLFTALGHPQSNPYDRSLDVLISRMRRKLSSSSVPIPIKSVRGVGYVFPRPAILRGKVAIPPNEVEEMPEK